VGRFVVLDKGLPGKPGFAFNNATVLNTSSALASSALNRTGAMALVTDGHCKVG
jgi:hypothetical protein